MTFKVGDVTGTYHWTCDANGLVSYDFGSLDTTQFGQIAEYSVNSTSGSWLPAANLLTVGYSWSNAYEINMKLTLPGGTGTGEGTMSISDTSTVTGTDPVTFGDKTFDGLQLSQDGTHEFSFTIQGVSAPAQASKTSSQYVLARGVGIVSSRTTGEGFSSSSTLVSYSVP
jgi:hypothetical protein